MQSISLREKGIERLDLLSLFSQEERKALAVVTSMDLGHNRLTELNGLQSLPGLTTLIVPHNRIAKPLKGLPMHLRVLDLSHNDLQSLHGLSSLPGLEELHVSHNKLNSLVGLPTTSQKLRVLKLGHNSLSTTCGLEVLGQLEVLELHHNKLEGAEEVAALGQLRKIRTLTLSGNPLCREAVDIARRLKAIIEGEMPPPPPPPPVQFASPSPPSPPPCPATGLGSMSFDSVKVRGEAKRAGQRAAQHKKEFDISELQRLLALEYQTNDILTKDKKRLEGNLSQTRRMLTEELRKLQELKNQNATLAKDLDTQKQRADKFSKEYKYAHKKLTEEKEKRVEGVERMRIQHNAHSHSLQSRLDDAERARDQSTAANRALKVENNRLQAYIHQLEREGASGGAPGQPEPTTPERPVGGLEPPQRSPQRTGSVGSSRLMSHTKATAAKKRSPSATASGVGSVLSPPKPGASPSRQRSRRGTHPADPPSPERSPGRSPRSEARQRHEGHYQQMHTTAHHPHHPTDHRQPHHQQQQQHQQQQPQPHQSYHPQHQQGHQQAMQQRPPPATHPLPHQPQEHPPHAHHPADPPSPPQQPQRDTQPASFSQDGPADPRPTSTSPPLASAGSAGPPHHHPAQTNDAAPTPLPEQHPPPRRSEGGSPPPEDPGLSVGAPRGAPGVQNSNPHWEESPSGSSATLGYAVRIDPGKAQQATLRMAEIALGEGGEGEEDWEDGEGVLERDDDQSVLVSAG